MRLHKAESLERLVPTSVARARGTKRTDRRDVQGGEIAPGLLACLDTARVWQFQQRDGYDFELQPVDIAISPEEDAVSVNAAIALRNSFAKKSPAVRALFDARVNLLTAAGRDIN